MLHDALLSWIAADDDPRRHSDSLPGVMRHLSDAWARRGEPNVLLVRYDDLLADLEGQMRRLAGRLAISRPGAGLARAHPGGHVRADEGPRGHPHSAPAGDFRERAVFFRRGTSGAGREILSDEEMAWLLRAGHPAGSARHARVAALAAGPD